MDKDHQRNAKKGDDEIRGDSRKRDDDVALLEVSIIARVYGDRLRAAKDWSICHEEQQWQNDRHERIDVLGRIPRQPPKLVRGHIAILERCISMRVLMRHHREQEDRRDENKILN
jgi:hypothetical protein